MKILLNLFILCLGINMMGICQSQGIENAAQQKLNLTEISENSKSKKGCECPLIQDVPSCFDLIPDELCNSVLFDLNGLCLPNDDCIASVSYFISLDGGAFSITNGPIDLNWTLPPGDWDGSTLIVDAVINLIDGNFCPFSTTIILDCPDCDCPLIHDGSQCFSIEQDEECTELSFDINDLCLPDEECISSFRYIFNFAGDPTTINSSTAATTWNIPEGDWDGEVIEVAALIFLENGEFCVVSKKIVLDCPTCECPFNTTVGCMDFILWDSGFCTGVTTGIANGCQPDPECVADIQWDMSIGNFTFDDVGDNQFDLGWTFPNPTQYGLNSWDGLDLEAQVSVTLTNGTVCTYTYSEELSCQGPPKMKGNGESTTRSQGQSKKSIFPNPIGRGHLLTIGDELLLGAVQIEVIDFRGIVIESLKPDQGEFQVTDRMTPGIYSIRVIRTDSLENYPFVVF